MRFGVKSWLLTLDHKRIALLYLLGITAMFFVGGAYAVMIRLAVARLTGIEGESWRIPVGRGSLTEFTVADGKIGLSALPGFITNLRQSSWHDTFPLGVSPNKRQTVVSAVRSVRCIPITQSPGLANFKSRRESAGTSLAPSRPSPRY